MIFLDKTAVFFKKTPNDVLDWKKSDLNLGKARVLIINKIYYGKDNSKDQHKGSEIWESQQRWPRPH